MFGVPLREAPRLAIINSDPPDPPRPGGGLPPAQPRGPPWAHNQFDVLASVPFSDGGWLNAQTSIRAEPVPWPWPSTISAALMAIAIFAIVDFIVRRATRPSAALADAAEAFGRGAAVRCRFPRPGRAKSGA